MIKNRKSMLRRILSPARAATIVGLAAITLGVGTGTANADVVKVPDVHVTKTTFNGTNLEINQVGYWLNSVVPLNGNPFAKDIFLGGNSDVKASGGRTPITSGNLEVGIQVGYQVDVSNGISLGARIEANPQAQIGIPAPLGPLATFIPGGAQIPGDGTAPPSGVFLDQIGNPGSLIQLPNSAGPLSFSLQNQFGAIAQVPIRPGQIVTIPINKRALTGPDGYVNMDN